MSFASCGGDALGGRGQMRRAIRCKRKATTVRTMMVMARSICRWAGRKLPRTVRYHGRIGFINHQRELLPSLGPGPALSAWSKQDKTLKKQGVPPKTAAVFNPRPTRSPQPSKRLPGPCYPSLRRSIPPSRSTVSRQMPSMSRTFKVARQNNRPNTQIDRSFLGSVPVTGETPQKHRKNKDVFCTRHPL